MDLERVLRGLCDSQSRFLDTIQHLVQLQIETMHMGEEASGSGSQTTTGTTSATSSESSDDDEEESPPRPRPRTRQQNHNQTSTITLTAGNLLHDSSAIQGIVQQMIGNLLAPVGGGGVTAASVDHERLFERGTRRIEMVGGGEGSAPTCSICLNSLTSDSMRKVIGCNHMFHEACLRRWVVTEHHASCPNCRQPIVASE
jgi:hypothetical protein